MRRFEAGLLVGFLLVIGVFWSLAVLTAATPWGAFWDNCHWTTAYLGGAFLSWLGFRRAELATPERVFRARLTLALASYSVGQIVWDVQVAVGWNPFPGPSDLFYLSLGPLILWAIYGSLRRYQEREPVVMPWVDTALLTLGMIAPLLAVYLPLQGQTPWFSFLVILLYPLFLLATLALSVLSFFFNDRTVQGHRVVFVATVFGSVVVWLIWNSLTLTGRLGDGTVLNLCFSVLALFMGWSGTRWTWSRQLRSEARPLLVLLPLVGLVTSVAGLVVVLALDSVPDKVLPLFYSMAALSVVLALVRQGAMVKEVLEIGRIKNRSRELEETLSRLQHTQDQLIQSEKLAALGQLIAGIAHDLNSPLGAIRSATGQIRAFSEGPWVNLMTNWEGLDQESRQEILAFLHRSSELDDYLEGRQERALRRQWTEAASHAGLEDPDRFGLAVVEAGLQDAPELAHRLLSKDDPFPFLEVLSTHRMLRQLTSLSIRASDRASGVINALRNYLHSGPEGPAIPFDLSENIRDVLPLFQHRARHGTKLNSAIEVGLFSVGWPDKLSQVWVNLLTNAFQAIESTGNVEIRGFRAADHLVVEVEDDGPGIAEAHRDRVFEAFFTTKKPGEGTGLGLDVCRRVVTEIGGTITFESAPGRTVFRVTLPFDQGLTPEA